MKYVLDEAVFIGCLITYQVYRGKIIRGYDGQAAAYDIELDNGKLYKWLNEDLIQKSFEAAKQSLLDWQIRLLIAGQQTIAYQRAINEELSHSIRTIQETVHEAV